MRRARQNHQKQERREAILAIALGALDHSPLQDITMTQIAEQAGLVKGTLYLYFTTREELFLEVFRSQLHGWFWDLETGLEDLPRKGRLRAVAHLIAATTAARPVFRQLLAVLHHTLETNLPETTTLAFQRERLARIASMGTALERALPFLGPGQGMHVVFRVFAWIIGIQSIIPPDPATQGLLDHAEFDALRMDDRMELQDGIEAILMNLRQKNRKRPTQPR